MTANRKHRCGGTLSPRQVIVATDEGSSSVALVPGLKCDKCLEELIDRETARRLGEHASLVSWDYPGTETTPPVRLHGFTVSSQGSYTPR
jgi:hypothetical protein